MPADGRADGRVRRLRRGLGVGVVVLLTVSLVAMGLLWPSAEPDEVDVVEPPPAETHRAELIDVVELGPDPAALMPDAVVLQITAELDDTGELVTFETVETAEDLFEPGQRVELAVVEGVDGEPTWFINDFVRDVPLALLVVLFAAAVVALGRWQGLRALIGLGITFAVILAFVVPAVLDGRDPVLVAVVGAVVIMVATLYLSHGFGSKTTAALVGTVGALALTAGLAHLFIEAAAITGLASEDARLAELQVGDLSLRGLLLAAIVIGALGVLDDVTMSQSSTVFALRESDPSAPAGTLFARAMRVGRDHVAATVNTLFLAYAGAALPLLILFVVGVDGVGTVVTSELVAAELVRTMVGSIGLVAAVPLATAVAVAVADPPTRRAER